MTKIKALHEFLLGLNLFAAEQMDSFVDDLHITPACRPAAEPGKLIVAEMDYTAAFYIERYPHHLRSPNELIGQLSAWLVQNDSDRLTPVRFDLAVDVLDTQVADLEFGIPFNEQVLAVADSNGSLTFNNAKFRVL